MVAASSTPVSTSERYLAFVEVHGIGAAKVAIDGSGASDVAPDGSAAELW